jgi:hypothetical protein
MLLKPAVTFRTFPLREMMHVWLERHNMYSREYSIQETFGTPITYKRQGDKEE